MKTHVIMPMGGAGSRFYKNGYALPKPLIEIQGKPFLFWATESLVKYIDVADLTFVVLEQHVRQFDIDSVIKSLYPDSHIQILPEILPGPVFTSLAGVRDINDDSPVIFNDCDHMFNCHKLYDALNNDDFDAGAALVTFESTEPQYSFVKYSSDGEIIGTVEKQVVSNRAICGAYLFQNTSVFRKAAKIYIDNCPYSECFMSGLYNVLIEGNYKIKDYFLDFHVEFGTPEEYEIAKESKYFSVFDK